jgi:hypothetical protein
VAALAVLTNTNNNYIYGECLSYVAQILKRPILLLYANASSGEQVYQCEFHRGCDKFIYHPDKSGQFEEQVSASSSDGKQLDYGINTKFPEDTIVIAMHPGHYYGVPSFGEQGLKFGSNAVTGVDLGTGCLTMKKNVVADSEGGESHIHDARAESSFKKLQKEYGIYYASPTADHTYKRVFLDAKNAETIGKSFCNCMLKLGSPEGLTTRSVKVMSESVDASPRNFYLAVVNLVQSFLPGAQNLKVDALYDVDVDDPRRPRQGTRSGEAKVPACVLMEMQVAQQNMAIRLLSYACKIMGGSTVNLAAAGPDIPPPVYSFALCMWDSDDKSLIKKESISTRNIDAKKEPFTELSVGNVFLGNVLPYGTAENDVTKARDALKEKVVTNFFDKGKDLQPTATLKERFSNLKAEEKQVYLWLEYIAFGHLMTPATVEASLACLDKKTDRKVFQTAYNAIKLKDITMERIQNGGPDLFRLIREKIQKETREIERETEKFRAENKKADELEGVLLSILQSNETLADSLTGRQKQLAEKILKDRTSAVTPQRGDKKRHPRGGAALEISKETSSSSESPSESSPDRKTKRRQTAAKNAATKASRGTGRKTAQRISPEPIVVE